jgi:hypothetical protein
MAIQGVVTSREVIRHPLLIISCFGFAAYARCCRALLSRERTTFLRCVLS